MKEVVLERVCPKCIAAGRPPEQAYGRRQRSSWWLQTDVDDLVREAIRRAAAAEGVAVADLTARERARIALAAMDRAGVPLDAAVKPIVWTQPAEDAEAAQLDATWTNDLAEHYARDHSQDLRQRAEEAAVADVSVPRRRT